MKTVGLEDFKQHVALYLHRGESLTIEHDGYPLAYVIPASSKKRKEEAAAAMKRLEEIVNQILEETGLTEDELAEFFDITKPLDEANLPRRRRPPQDHAPRA